MREKFTNLINNFIKEYKNNIIEAVAIAMVSFLVV